MQSVLLYRGSKFVSGRYFDVDMATLSLNYRLSVVRIVLGCEGVCSADRRLSESRQTRINPTAAKTRPT